MKKSVILLLTLFTAHGVFAQYDPKALEILDAMSKKYKSIPAFEATLVSNLINESQGVKEEFTKTELTDLNRTLNENDKVNFLEDIKIF